MALDFIPVLTSRPAESDEDAMKIGRLIVEMSKEVGRAAPDPNKAFIEIYRVLKEEAAWVVEDQNGLVVASLGIVSNKEGAWYSREPFLSEQWFYVLPALRRGDATKMLLAELQSFCDAVKMPAFIKYFDPQRLRSVKSKVFVGEESVYIPAGRIARINPFGVPIVNEG